MKRPGQLGFEFQPDTPPPQPAPDHPLVILRFDDGYVHSYWPEFDLRGRFESWAVVFDTVLAPPNLNIVSIRVRP